MSPDPLLLEKGLLQIDNILAFSVKLQPRSRVSLIIHINTTHFEFGG